MIKSHLVTCVRLLALRQWPLGILARGDEGLVPDMRPHLVGVRGAFVTDDAADGHEEAGGYVSCESGGD